MQKQDSKSPDMSTASLQVTLLAVCVKLHVTTVRMRLHTSDMPGKKKLMQFKWKKSKTAKGQNGSSVEMWLSRQVSER